MKRGRGTGVPLDTVGKVGRAVGYGMIIYFARVKNRLVSLSNGNHVHFNAAALL